MEKVAAEDSVSAACSDSDEGDIVEHSWEIKYCWSFFT